MSECVSECFNVFEYMIVVVKDLLNVDCSRMDKGLNVKLFVSV